MHFDRDVVDVPLGGAGPQGHVVDATWQQETVELTTVGIDIGSSTSHLLFARVVLQRRTQELSSRFEVVERQTLWRSPVALTPYEGEERIDAGVLRAFVDKSYAEAGLGREDVDSGAVILTGVALLRRNARSIVDLFAEEGGKFVCASAGHHLEALMAAQGSGAAALSRARGAKVLNVDIGGGTSKLCLIDGGLVVATAALGVGGRLVAWDEQRRVERVEPTAADLARRHGVPLRLGEPLPEAAERRLVGALVDALVPHLAGEPLSGDAARLLLTEPLAGAGDAEVLTVSGGVGEYLRGRRWHDVGDLGASLAEGLQSAISDGRVRLPVEDPGEGIRATVIGAAQFTVEVSGNTIVVSDPGLLPVRNLPVLYPDLPPFESLTVEGVARAVRDTWSRWHDAEAERPAAIGVRWGGPPEYAKLRAVAEGLVAAADQLGVPREHPIVLLVDRDIAKTVGRIVTRDLGRPRGIVALDGLGLRPFDHVDIGTPVQPADVVPVIVKSLLFGYDEAERVG